jgi:hypothetical protein
MPFETFYKNEANEERTNKSKVIFLNAYTKKNNYCIKREIKNQNLHEIKCYPFFFLLIIC